MKFNESFQVALTNIRVNKSRSFFSMLGIVIGSASVILVISVVNGTRLAALAQAMAGKENLLTLQGIYSEGVGRTGHISLDDIEKIRQLPFVQTVYPVLDHETNARGTFARTSVNAAGINFDYFEVYKLRRTQGRFFSEEDTRVRSRICVISDKIANKLFGFDYPIGQSLRLSEGSLEVVGVFKAEQRLGKMDQHANVLVPLYTAMQLFKADNFSAAQVRMVPGQVDEGKEALTDLLTREKRITEIAILDIRDDLKETREWAHRWLVQMAFVASISLLVGGVGLMNVMLTTVAERTHEIGLRKALGADAKAVLHQFLVESMVLSGVGGMLGVCFGVFLSYAVEVMTKGKISVAILPVSLLISFGFSVLTGIIFGLFPASKAAHLSPVEALRYE